MGSPTVFSGSRTKLLSSKGLSLKDGSIVDNDGVPNFIKNGHAEIDTTGWATYADAAQSTPVDGTGGTANVTWARTTTTPLAGAGSFTFTKDTANRQGQGVSYTFTVDPSYRARVCNIQFDYIFTNINGSFDTSNPNLTVYIYDVTNATVIQPSSFGFLSNSQTISDTFQSSFQTSATGSQYRLIFHVATVSTSGYTIKFDNIQVTPTEYAYGTPVSDEISWTPTLTNAGNATATATRQRIGDSIKLIYKITIGSSLPTGTISVSKPTDVSFDFTTNQLIPDSIAKGAVELTGSTYQGTPRWDNTNQRIDILGGNGQQFWNTTVPVTWAANDKITIVVQSKVLGWSSSVQTSDQTSTRVVAMRSGTGNASGTLAAGFNNVTFSTTSKVDTLNAFDGTAYTIPVAGIYRISAQLAIAGTYANTNYGGVQVTVDGTGVALRYEQVSSSTGTTYPNVSTIQQLNAGQIVRIQAACNATSPSFATTGSFNYFTLERISGPNQIAASETVSALYTGAPPTGTLNNSFNTTTFGTKVKDSHGAYSGGTYTVPISGQYDISAAVLINGSANGYVDIGIFIDGVQKYNGFLDSSNLRAAPQVNVNAIPLLAGQLITIKTATNLTSPTFGTTGAYNLFSINKSGNY